MQRNYETMSLYALMFTIVGVIITAVTACIEGGALRPAFLAFCRWTRRRPRQGWRRVLWNRSRVK